MLGRSLYIFSVYTLKFCYYTLVGVLTVLRGLFKLPGAVKHTRRLLSAALICPWCLEDNPTYGRWLCAACGATTLSHVAECALCHASCSWFACRGCGGSIPLGKAQ